MKIDGKDIADWGLRVIKYDGILNLPARKEPTAYDWGDFPEPLVDSEDIHFQSNIFSLELFYSQALVRDDEIAGSRLDSFLEHFYPLLQEQVALETSYKRIRARLKEIKAIKSFQKGKYGRFSLIFEEEGQPSYSYPEGLLKVDQVGLSIDHYHVEENFALILESFQEDGVSFAESPLKMYHEVYFIIKKECEIHLKLSGLYPNLGVTVEKIETFKALLGCPGMRVMSYRGYDYYCYLTSGIRVKLLRENMAQLEFSLKINDKIRTCHAHL